jgi:cytochrome c oxidase subunit IV
VEFSIFEAELILKLVLKLKVQNALTRRMWARALAYAVLTPETPITVCVFMISCLHACHLLMFRRAKVVAYSAELLSVSWQLISRSE